MGCSKNSSQREVNSDTGIKKQEKQPQKTRIHHIKKKEKGEPKKPKVRRRNDIINTIQEIK